MSERADLIAAKERLTKSAAISTMATSGRSRSYDGHQMQMVRLEDLRGEPNTDLYHRIADEHLQWAADLRYFLATPPGRWVPLEPTGFRLSRQRR